MLTHYFGKFNSLNLPRFTEVNFTNISYLAEYETFYVTDWPTDNVTTIALSVHTLPAHMREDGHATRQLLCQWYAGPCHAKRSLRQFSTRRSVEGRVYLPLSHLLFSRLVTACTVVQAVVKATSQSNWKGQILTPWGSETPERISMKFGIYNRVADMTTHANPCGAATTWVVWANTWKNTCCGSLGILFKFFSFLLYS